MVRAAGFQPGPAISHLTEHRTPGDRLLDEEASLVARAQQGDALAYEGLVRRYQQIAFRVAFLVTRDEQEAADAAQDAFLRAYRGLHSFQVGQPFRPWLLRIVTNLAINRLRAAGRQTRAINTYAQRALADQVGPSPEHAYVERERNERLLSAVQRLSPEEQSLIALRFYIELPEGEVAEILNVPLGTVKSRLHRTLARLREIIRSEFPELGDLAI